MSLLDALDLAPTSDVWGRQSLPPKSHARRSPPLSYDLDDPVDRARIYEQVLREGTDDDVRFYVRVDELVDLRDRLALPPQVRRRWVQWFRRHRSLELWC